MQGRKINQQVIVHLYSYSSMWTLFAHFLFFFSFFMISSCKLTLSLWSWAILVLVFWILFLCDMRSLVAICTNVVSSINFDFSSMSILLHSSSCQHLTIIGILSQLSQKELGVLLTPPTSRSTKISQPKLVDTSGELILTVHIPKAIEIFVRPPISVHNTRVEWYQYVELIEKEEEEMRLKWYF
ncbi:hypothetical protein Fmac_015611 [Flemingia macrophylla]|uniref:Uncharacterized protein n=1 Tax=Flemingia macrophylla TaxID=520843 RepID=A0ABD1MFY3_9FABA